MFINGNLREKYIPDEFNFTPVTTGIKVLIIYAKDDSQIFHLAEGIEGSEAVIPDYSGLFVASIIVSDNGEIVTEAGDSSYKHKGDDIIEPLVINDNYGIWTLALRNTYEVLNHSTSATPTLFGVYTDAKNGVWSGKKFYFKNSSGKILTLKKEPTPPIAGETVYFSFNETINLKNGEMALGFLNRFSEIEVIRLVGSEPFDPTNLQNQIDAETVNRAIGDSALDGKITTEKNRNDAQDLAITDLYVHSIAITTTTSITTDTTDANGRVQNGREVAIKNGVNTINLTCEITSPANFVASYTKEGSAAITVLAGAGTTLYQTDGTNVINGIKGSTFCIKRSGNEFQLQISNR